MDTLHATLQVLHTAYCPDSEVLTECNTKSSSGDEQTV